MYLGTLETINQLAILDKYLQAYPKTSDLVQKIEGGWGDTVEYSTALFYVMHFIIFTI